MENVMILSALRTAVGSFGGQFKDVTAARLGAEVIGQAIDRANMPKDSIDELIFGCVLQGGQGQNIARQSSLLAGLPESVPSLTINKVCGSGLRAVSLGAQTIMTGDNQVIVVGGTENMSQSGYVLEGARSGYKMGNQNVIDMMIKDGLWDAVNDYHMGITAENVAIQYGITREEQDQFAVSSQNKAERAQLNNRFENEICPIVLKDRKGNDNIIDKDEYIRYDSTIEKLSKLKPAFKKDGTVTAGNASGINDGAAALVLASEGYVKDHQLNPMAQIVSYASVGLDPKVMGLGPIYAIRKALDKAGLKVEDIDLFEVNEAFASQSLAVIKELKLDVKKVNVNGGAIAIGHPIGASGARILVTLIHELKKQGLRYGVASLCIGGGLGTALIVENIK